MNMRRLQSVFLFFTVLLTQHNILHASHGASIDGNLKYPQDFHHFDYVSPAAKKGGQLVLHELGSFDKLNPFTLKGEAPLGVESLVFEPLAVASLDEPFALYGLLAKEIKPAEDRTSVTFTLHQDAVYSDESPVTAQDVGFTIDTLKSESVHPYYNYYYQDISGYEILGPKTIKVLFSKPNRELHMITAQIRVIPRKLNKSNFWPGASNRASKDESLELQLPIGSGPYIVDEFKIGKTIKYKRNNNYWAKDHPTRLGIFNYDEILIKYYKDQVISLEAFKAGEFDFMSINIAKQWARDLVGKKYDNGILLKKTYPHLNNEGIQGFVFNTRRSLFQDRRVRQALGLALDFEWINKSLFHNQYTRNDSYFSNSYLAARGIPQGLELEYLQVHKDVLPPELFTTPLSAPIVKNKRDLRKNLLLAKKLLKESGWKIEEGQLRNEEGGKFEFDIMLSQPSFERVMAAYIKNLKVLGITAHYRTTDSALYIDRVKKFDFDMIVTRYAQSQSPGNEQRDLWHSAAVDRVGSRNYPGVKSIVVDDLVEKIIYATNQEELKAACMALDRVLWYGYYLIPNWYLNVHRLTYDNSFEQPEKLPLYYDPFQLLMTWWKKDV